MVIREAKNSLGARFQVFVNPRTEAERLRLGPTIRFTADNRSKTAYLWTFNTGHHANVSVALKLNDTFSDPELLRGAAQLADKRYCFVASDFFSSFGARLTREDRIFLIELFSRDWSWVNPYILVSDYLRNLQKRFGL
jgi:hypothetical protein